MITPHSSGNPADQELIAAINAGDEQAFEWIYERHREWVFRMACRICDSEHHAQDVVQDVFRYFLSKFPGFELRCDLRTFLYPAVRNLSLGALRGTHRFIGGDAGAVVLDQIAAPAETPAGNHDLRQIIAKLGADHREVLMLRFVDGMTLPEIAALTGIPLGTAKSRLHHALAALRTDPKIKQIENPLNDSPIDRT